MQSLPKDIHGALISERVFMFGWLGPLARNSYLVG